MGFTKIEQTLGHKGHAPVPIISYNQLSSSVAEEGPCFGFFSAKTHRQ